VSVAPLKPPRLATALAVAVALLFPTAMASVYFLALGGTGRHNLLQQIAYGAGKTFQFAIPLLFLVLVERRRPEWQRPNTSGLLLGVGFGVLVGALILGAWYAGLHSSRVAEQASARLRVKLAEFGITSGVEYLALCVFLCVAHSFLEEYYWRWFVFGRLRTLLPLWPAVVVSSLGFMAHHVLIVWAYVPDRILTAVLPASLAVAVGGAVWAWLYERSGSLVAPWISHALIDAALFVVGWDMMRSV
jgi:membrane protease YdiL (CAAX protease family)